MIEIYWDDLTEEKQQEIMDKCGSNCNFDVFPAMQILEDEKNGDRP